LCICFETTVIELYQYQVDIEQGRYRYRANRAAETGRTQVGAIPSYGLTAEYAVSLRDEQVRAVVREGRRDETAMKKRLLEFYRVS